MKRNIKTIKMKRVGRIAKVGWVVLWSYVWTTAFNHYYTIGKVYADAGVFNTNPVIYSAVESWFLLTVIVLMWLSWKLMEVISDAKS